MVISFPNHKQTIKNMKIKSAAKIECEQYLGNRGIYQDIQRCAKYQNVWFILFVDDSDVELSFAGYCYECYDLIPKSKMKWDKASIKRQAEKLIKWNEDYNKRQASKN